MIVAGIMSGTSADGINVALIDVVWRGRPRPRASSSANLAFKFLAQAEYPYPKKVRQAVMEAMNAKQASVANLARLNFLLAELYAEAVLATQRRFHLKAELIGCHGQTLYHQGEPAKFLGRKLAVTWQTGEGAVLAARVGVPVVSDFRPADMAAGGKGAPLVPFLDYLLYRDPQVGRIVQNIGGIANLTAIPASATAKQVTAFDTGPGNMLIDAVTDRLFGQPYDRDGRIAASGAILDTGYLRSPAPAILPPQAAENRRTRRIRTRIRPAFRQPLWTRKQARCRRHGHRVDSAFDRRCHKPLRAAKSRKVSRFRRFRRWR